MGKKIIQGICWGNSINFQRIQRLIVNVFELVKEIYRHFYFEDKSKNKTQGKRWVDISKLPTFDGARSANEHFFTLNTHWDDP